MLHKPCGQYADTQFIINRLGYYHFSHAYKIVQRNICFAALKNKFFYTDTGSLFVVFKKA